MEGVRRYQIGRDRCAREMPNPCAKDGHGGLDLGMGDVVSQEARKEIGGIDVVVKRLRVFAQPLENSGNGVHVDEGFRIGRGY